MENILLEVKFKVERVQIALASLIRSGPLLYIISDLVADERGKIKAGWLVAVMARNPRGAIYSRCVCVEV
jgi:hypothetical protein